DESDTIGSPSRKLRICPEHPPKKRRRRVGYQEVSVMRILAFALIAFPALQAFAEQPPPDLPRPVRIADGVKGHIHPAICVARSGAIVVIFSKADFKDLRVSRSTDGGKTWSEPAPFPHTKDMAIYPGSLTTLADGRIVHVWNTWYGEGKGKSRYP